jgi:putative nucleotidyltransferase with HDIG domain
MEGWTALARRLLDSRGAIADTVLERLEPHSAAHASQLIVRSLVSALGQAIDGADPAPVVSWARMAHAAHALPVIQDLVSLTTAVAAETGEALELDFSALLVFLEIVKANVAEAFPTPLGRRIEDPLRGSNAMIDAVLTMLKARDEATCAHSHATGAWCRRLAGALGLSRERTDLVVKAGVLHDIGKVGTPDAILLKAGPLDADEWAVMRKHAEFGADILTELPALAQYAPIVRAHHERWDGQGYPSQLAGEQILFEARIVAVADAFHAMVSNRPYRAAIAQREAMEILRAGRGTQWDPEVVDAMMTVLEAPRNAGRREAARG